MYDAPYRLEQDGYDGPNGSLTFYAIVRTGEGTICRGTNFTEMRNLVDRANEAEMIEQGDRGR